MQFYLKVLIKIQENLQKISDLNWRNWQIFRNDSLEGLELVSEVTGLGNRRVIVIGGWLDAERVRIAAGVGPVLQAEARSPVDHVDVDVGPGRQDLVESLGRLVGVDLLAVKMGNVSFVEKNLCQKLKHAIYVDKPEQR